MSDNEYWYNYYRQKYYDSCTNVSICENNIYNLNSQRNQTVNRINQLMTHGRTGRNGSYTQANKKFAQMLNDSPDLANDFGIKPKNGKTFTASDISEYMQNNKLTWYELNDLTTIQMVPTKVNSKFTHLGVISEAKLK